MVFRQSENKRKHRKEEKLLKTIAVMIEKGGAGKTTTAAAVGHLLAADHRVLLIDADQQGNLSTLFGVDDPEDKGLAALLEDTTGSTTVADVVKRSVYGLDVIPANGYLMDANREITMDDEHDQVHRLQAALAVPAVTAAYDYVVIDCGLLLDMTVLNALVASDMVLIPVKPGGFEAKALDSLADTAEQLRAIGKDLNLRTFLTMSGKNQTCGAFEFWLRVDYGKIEPFWPSVSRSVVVERASIEGKPVTAYRPRCKVAKQYAALVREIKEALK